VLRTSGEMERLYGRPAYLSTANTRRRCY
jgi:hypothetical protein